MSNSIVQMVLMLLVVGVILFFASSYLPVAIVQLILAVCAIGVLFWLLRLVGYIGGPPGP